jgi:hypothetical protein
LLRVLAVTVDLGWSWWVTTFIAAGVALLAALAFVRTRRVTVRAVAALILLEAIAIGIVAPFVMKSHKNTNGTSAMNSAGADFARKADANCSALNAYISTLGNPTKPAGIARKLDKVLPALWQKIVQQGDLAPPPDKQATARQWMHAMAAYGQDTESLRAAASQGDTKGMQRANAQATADARRSALFSKDLGLHVCFQ